MFQRPTASLNKPLSAQLIQWLWHLSQCQAFRRGFCIRALRLLLANVLQVQFFQAWQLGQSFYHCLRFLHRRCILVCIETCIHHDWQHDFSIAHQAYQTTASYCWGLVTALFSAAGNIVDPHDYSLELRLSFSKDPGVPAIGCRNAVHDWQQCIDRYWCIHRDRCIHILFKVQGSCGLQQS